MDKKVETMKISFQEPGLHTMHGVEQVWWWHWIQHYQHTNKNNYNWLILIEIGNL